MNKRRFFIILGFLAFVFLILFNYNRFGELGHYLRRTNWYALSIIIPLQLAGYFFTAKFYQTFLRLFDVEMPIDRPYKMALSLNFVNQAFPSGGVSALSYMSRELVGVPSGKVTLTHFMRYLFTYLSFLVVLILGFLILLLSGNLSAFTARLTLLVVLAVLVLSGIAMGIMSNRSRVGHVVNVAAASVNKFWQGVLKRPKPVVTEAQKQRFVREFHDGYDTLNGKRRGLVRPLLCLLGTNFTEVATIYIVFLAFGSFINPGVVIAGYTLANIVSVLGVFTGGVGVFEATMAGTFAALGVPLALATAVVLVYRALNFIIFLPLGFFFYRESLKR